MNLGRKQALEIEKKLAFCGLNRVRDEAAGTPLGRTLVDVIVQMGFEQGMRFSKENPEYALALFNALQNVPGQPVTLPWMEKATIEFRQVMEQYPITSSMSEDEFNATLEQKEEVT